MCYPITPFPGSHTRRQPHPRLDALLIAVAPSVFLAGEVYNAMAGVAIRERQVL